MSDNERRLAVYIRRLFDLVADVTSNDSHPKDPLHGVTLEKLLTELVEAYGWAELGARIEIRCFNFDPSIKSSLQFLRKTPWARKKVEELYLGHKAAG